MSQFEKDRRVAVKAIAEAEKQGWSDLWWVGMVGRTPRLIGVWPYSHKKIRFEVPRCIIGHLKYKR